MLGMVIRKDKQDVGLVGCSQRLDTQPPGQQHGERFHIFPREFLDV